jgi:hypothetical protein
MTTNLGRRGPLVRAAALLALTLFAFACNQGPQSSTDPNASPTATPVPSGTETLAPVASDSASPAPAVAKIAQEPVTYSPPPPPTPTPTPDPALWRYEGVVVDDGGKPIEDVCIAVGPHGCQPSSVRTDKRGVWHIDFPQAPVDYDLHFAKPGFKTFDVRVTPTSGWTLNVILKG